MLCLVSGEDTMSQAVHVWNLAIYVLKTPWTRRSPRRINMGKSCKAAWLPQSSQKKGLNSGTVRWSCGMCATKVLLLASGIWTKRSENSSASLCAFSVVSQKRPSHWWSWSCEELIGSSPWRWSVCGLQWLIFYSSSQTGSWTKPWQGERTTFRAKVIYWQKHHVHCELFV